MAHSEDNRRSRNSKDKGDKQTLDEEGEFSRTVAEDSGHRGDRCRPPPLDDAPPTPRPEFTTDNNFHPVEWPETVILGDKDPWPAVNWPDAPSMPNDHVESAPFAWAQHGQDASVMW